MSDVWSTFAAPVYCTGISTLLSSSRSETNKLDLGNKVNSINFFILECLYEYTAHPMMNLTCDPFGSSLQLHCGMRGPLHPEFHIQWYLSSSDESAPAPVPIDDDDEDYNIGSSVLNVVGDVETPMRSVTSILTTVLLADTHQEVHCIQCRVAFVDMGLSLGNEGSKICLGSAARYTALASCSADLVVKNSTALCATAQDLLPALETPVPTASFASPSPTQPTILQASLVSSPPPMTELLGMVTPSPSLPVQSTALRPKASSMSPSLSAAPIATVIPSGGTTTPSSNSTATDGSQAAVEGGLFVAIGICIIFIVIIIILMYFVVRLCRQWKWKKGKKQDEDASECPCVAI